eukprot:TRINITY_DN9732_c0_g1_i1.p1 TRINITY_DN9732_c0_g1~~TRINITY_DN9732_c0_g1_i1.p1  ORF type:complete len:612 (+),score=225.57 TRINITY_DN9732_c0_g1_i1:49-1884(+)
MAYNVNTAAEVQGVKHNYELAFHTRPSLGELRAEAEAVFSRVVPKGSFRIEKLQVFDEVLQGWADLMSEQQLQHGCQVFGIELGGHNPLATEIVRPASPAASAPSTAPPAYERARDLFHSLAVSRPDGIVLTEFVAGMLALRLDFSEGRLYELFARADVDGDGVLSLSEFFAFAEHYPSLTDTAYFRKRDLRSEFAAEAEATRLRVALTTLDERSKENTEQLRAIDMEERENRTKLRTQEGTITLMKQREREASELLAKSSSEVEAAARGLEESRRLLGGMRDEAASKEATLLQVEAEAEAVRHTVDGSQREAEVHVSKIEALEKQLEHHRAELQRCLEAQKVCTGHHAAAETRKRLAMEEVAQARQAANDAAERVGEAERTFRNKLKVEEEAVANASSTSVAMDKELRSYDAVAAATQQARNMKEDLLAEEATSRRQRTVMLTRKDDIELDTRLLSEVRCKEDAEEMHFVEREMALREQRHMLENRERVLHQQHRARPGHAMVPAPLPPSPSSSAALHQVTHRRSPVPVPTINATAAVDAQFGVHGLGSTHGAAVPPPPSLPPSGLVLTEAERAAVLRARSIAAAAAASPYAGKSPGTVPSPPPRVPVGW